MTQEAEKREKRLWVDLKLLRSQQELTLGILDTRIDVMVERCTQTIMDRLDDLLGNRSGCRNRGGPSSEASREPRINFNEREEGPMGPQEHKSTRELIQQRHCESPA